MLLIVATLIIVIFVLVLVAADLDWLHHLPTLFVPDPVAMPAPQTFADKSAENRNNEQPPTISVIIPARNEAENIGRCLAGLVNQQFPLPYEVIVVDDGSTDDTPKIVAEYTARYPHLVRVIGGGSLPAGWVGKCHACQQGSDVAQGEWLLFLDADTVPEANLLFSLLSTALDDQLDVISAMPFNELISLPERVILPIFWRFAFVVFPGMRGHRPTMKPEHAIAVGQCFMFKTRVYRAVGGHGAVADKVLEDVEFAQVVRAAGYRLGLYTGFDAIRVRMYHNLDEVTRGLMKHARAGQRLSGWRGYWGIFSSVALTLLPLILLIARLIQWRAINYDGVFGIGVLAALVCYVASLQLWADLYHDLFRLSRWHAFLAPIGMLAYLSISLLGILNVAFGRGVAWKGRVYESGKAADAQPR